MREVPASQLLVELEGATITGVHVEDESGMHIELQDGRIFVIAGYFAVSVLRQDRKDLH